METRQMRLYGGRVYGEKVSDYGLKNGYLDYYTLSRIVGDCILNNTLMAETYLDDWEMVCGDDYDADIFQYYIITEAGYQFLEEFTDEIVYYNQNLDIYLWGITHFGTSWDYVLTDIKLVEE